MSGSTTVNVSDVALSLEAAGGDQVDLVLAAPQGTLRVRGTVTQLRQAAQGGLSLPIPAAPAPSHAAPAASAGSDVEARMARMEDAVARLADIAERAQRRGLI